MSKKLPQRRLLFGLVIVSILVLQAITIAIIMDEHQKTQKQVNINRVKAENALLFAQSRSFEDNFWSEPQINASEKRVYFPRLGLWLPMNVQTTDIVYRVIDESGGGTIDAVFTTRSNLEVYTLDDTVDRCNELVRIEIGADDAVPGIGEVGLEPVQLDDSTKAYIHYYTEGKDLCQYFADTPQEIAQMLTDLRTY